jgi:hypothetical protein
MPVGLYGKDLASLVEVDSVHGGVHVSLRPTDVAGSFLAGLAGTTAAGPAAGANLASLRWTSATKLALIRRIRLELLVTTASSAGIPEIAAYVARSFSVSDSAGTAVTTSGDNLKRRQSLASTALATGDLRFATGGVLTAGTRTLDSLPIIQAMAPLAVGTGVQWAEFGGAIEDEPIVLAANEGLVIQNVAALTAGIFRFHVQLEWDEILNAKWP